MSPGRYVTFWFHGCGREAGLGSTGLPQPRQPLGTRVRWRVSTVECAGPCSSVIVPCGQSALVHRTSSQRPSRPARATAALVASSSGSEAVRTTGEPTGALPATSKGHRSHSHDRSSGVHHVELGAQAVRLARVPRRGHLRDVRRRDGELDACGRAWAQQEHPIRSRVHADSLAPAGLSDRDYARGLQSGPRNQRPVVVVGRWREVPHLPVAPCDELVRA